MANNPSPFAHNMRVSHQQRTHFLVFAIVILAAVFIPSCPVARALSARENEGHPILERDFSDPVDVWNTNGSPPHAGRPVYAFVEAINILTNTVDITNHNVDLGSVASSAPQVPSADADADADADTDADTNDADVRDNPAWAFDRLQTAFATQTLIDIIAQYASDFHALHRSPFSSGGSSNFNSNPNAIVNANANGENGSKEGASDHTQTMFYSAPSPDPTQCIQSFMNLSTATDPVSKQMVAFSGKGLNDMGDYEGCQTTLSADQAVYCRVFLGGTTLYSNIGVCAPATCDEQTVQQVMTYSIKQTMGLDIVPTVYCGDNKQPWRGAGETVMAGISMALLALVVIGTLAEAMIQHMSERVGRIEKVGPKSKHVSASALPPSPSSSFPSSSLPSSSSSSSYLPPVVLTRVCAPYYGPSDAEGDHSPGYTARPGKQHTLSTQARKTNSARDLTLESGEGSDAAQPSFAVRMLICFSVIRNLRSLFAARKASVIKCLDGIRVLSICYVIMGHTLVTSLSIGFKNAMDILPSKGSLGKFYFQIVQGGFFSVDAFFFLSGFLLTINTIAHVQKYSKREREERDRKREEEEKRGKIRFLTDECKDGKESGMEASLLDASSSSSSSAPSSTAATESVMLIKAMPSLIVHRFLRLTPVYMFVLFFYWFLFGMLYSGPFWLGQDDPRVDEKNDCIKYWWANLLYVNNFVRAPMGSSCLGVSWYLANDMQLFVAAPIFIALYLYRRSLGIAATALMLLGNIGILLYLSVRFDLSPSMFGSGYKDYYNKTYIKPWSRCGPFLVGMLFGYMYDRWLQLKQDSRLKVERQIHVVKEEEVGGVLARRHQQLPSKRGQYDSYIDVNIDKENEEKGKENRRENKGAYEMRMCVRDGDMLDVNDAGAGKREKPSKSSSASSASAKQIDSLVEKEMKAYMSRVLSPSTSFALLTLAVSVLLACVFGTYRDNHYTAGFTRLENVLYISLSRSAFAVALGVLVTMCILNNGSFIQSFLESNFWAPLSKLSFCVYLCHMMMIELNNGSTLVTRSYSEVWFWLTFLSMVCSSFGASLALWLVVEKPLANLTRMILG